MSSSAPSLHRCEPIHTPVKVGERAARLPWKTFDVHCHVLAPAVERLVSGHPLREEEVSAGAAAMGVEATAVNVAMISSLLPRLTDLETRRADMDAMGVDVQVLSPSPTQYYSWAEPGLAERIVEGQNDAIADLCRRDPQHFIGLGAVSLQHPERAARQMETSLRERGFKGVEIPARVGEEDICERRFDVFWAKAEALGAIVFIHPWGTTLGTRLASHYLMNVIGQPFETTVCLSKLIFSGALDRYPGLKIVAAHGGGYLPQYAGRSDHARAVRADVTGCQCRPSGYLRRIWFDSVVYDGASLGRLIDEVGAERVLLGTDYPFDMGHYDPASLVRALDERTQQLVLGGNAARLLGIIAT